jgi:hypothetical protein
MIFSDPLGQLAGCGAVTDISADSEREWEPAPQVRDHVELPVTQNPAGPARSPQIPLAGTRINLLSVTSLHFEKKFRLSAEG